MQRTVSSKNRCITRVSLEPQENGAADSQVSEQVSIRRSVQLQGEYALLTVRASAATADFSYAAQHLAIGVAVGRFEIEDLLVGQRCKAYRFLARSYEATAEVCALCSQLPVGMRHVHVNSNRRDHHIPDRMCCN